MSQMIYYICKVGLCYFSFFFFRSCLSIIERKHTMRHITSIIRWPWCLTYPIGVDYKLVFRSLCHGNRHAYHELLMFCYYFALFPTSNDRIIWYRYLLLSIELYQFYYYYYYYQWWLTLRDQLSCKDNSYVQSNLIISRPLDVYDLFSRSNHSNNIFVGQRKKKKKTVFC